MWRVFADFQNLFYSISIFEEWKKSIGNTSLIFEDFSNTKVFDGVVVSKSEDERLAKLAKNMTRQMTIKKGSTFILVKTNQLAILDDFFKYANHINRMMKNGYFVRANDELKNIESRSNLFFLWKFLDSCSSERFPIFSKALSSTGFDLARPKSHIFTEHSLVRRIFPGLRSR